MKKIYTLILAICLSSLLKISAQCNAPIINSFSPTSALIGSSISISGSDFDATPANNQVFFGATQATVLSASSGLLTVTVPVGSTSSLISVKNNCNKVAYSSLPFNALFCPTPLNNTTYNNTATQINAKGAYNLSCYDMDLDGKPDLISGGMIGGGFTIARNVSTPGTLSFSGFDISCPGPSGQAIADFDGDGKLDIIFASNGPVYLLRNTSTPGSLSFASYITITPNFGFYQIAIGDFNNDGRIDFATEGNNTMRTYLNNSSGTGNISFAANTTINVGDRCTGIQCADIDGDGLTDIIATQGNSNRAISLQNTNTSAGSTFSFGSPAYWNSGGLYPYRCQIGDFDNDGKIDLATCNYDGTSNIAILRNASSSGSISFASAVTFSASSAVHRIAVGDVNGDGLADIVTKSLGQNVFSAYPNTSSGAGDINFGTRVDFSSSAQAELSGIAIADLDGDYIPDIATSGIFSNTIRFHRNTSYETDNTNPNAICKNISIGLNLSGTATVFATMIDNGSSDACGIDSLLINGKVSETFSCSNIGTNSVILTVKDRSGNKSTCNANVTVIQPVINVLGNSISITDGDNTPSTSDATDLGNNGTSTFTISNSGNGNLNIANITISGANASNFTLGGITLPIDIGANSSTTFSIAFNASNSGAKNAVVSIINNDCNISNFDFGITGELSCTTPQFISCTANKNVNVSGTNCNAAVSYIPEISGIPTPSLTYTFSGATSGSGSGNGSGSSFNPGITNVTLLATNSCGSNSCSFTITVNSIKPTVSISQTNLPGFCQGRSIELSANATGGNTFTYLWNTNATTKSINIQNANTFSVLVTNNYGCKETTSANISFDFPSLFSSYTILATDEIELDNKSEVQTGGVGVFGCDGEIDLDDHSKISGTNTFAKAKKYKINGNSSITTKYTSAVNVDLPDFKYNPYCDNECKSKNHKQCGNDCKNSSHNHCKSDCKERNHSKRCHSKFHKHCGNNCKNKNHVHCKSSCKEDDHNHCSYQDCSDDDHHHCSISCHSNYHKNCNSNCYNSSHIHCKSNCNNGGHNHCPVSNCKGKNDISVGSNKTVTLCDSVYGKIAIGKNSTVTFTNDVIYIKELKTSDGVTIKFSEACVQMMVCDDVDLKKDNQFNSTGKSVVMYIEHDFNANENSVINSSIYSQDNITIDGTNNNITQMKGLFIAEKVNSQYTQWNWNTTCGSCNILNKKSSYTSDLDGLTDPTQILFNVFPNPNKGDFGIDIITNQTGLIKIAVMDLLGRIIYSETQILNGPVFIPVNLAAVANGQYIVRAEINGQLFTRYVLIQK